MAGRPSFANIEWNSLAEVRLRPTGFGVTASAAIGLAQPKQAKPAEAGGARRDRTADLIIANDALSQLSYGPVCSRQQRPSSPSRLRRARFALVWAWLRHAQLKAKRGGPGKT